MKILAIYKKNALYITLAFLIVYFVSHSFLGNKGIFAYNRLKQQVHKATLNLEELMIERASIMHKMHLIQSHDIDLIDELLRKNLGVALEHEIVFSPQNTKQKPAHSE
ncbi:Septum formation initiator family protein [Rickettsiales endosymbiont of Paramecium tredecaurelia]|uniref:FtsB family cell division protein n=1 Tax=Candidatus Sarmatiella mevalonica TaxID=2770581 RepID=UPI0019209E32|nr:septum formation initiator family protein [Candidatus Sarmatiella mevalonica]MBL3284270.1 Septum formation initiator family protein [Candidatus Sarmatiella mevalonica]